MRIFRLLNPKHSSTTHVSRYFFFPFANAAFHQQFNKLSSWVLIDNKLFKRRSGEAGGLSTSTAAAAPLRGQTGCKLTPNRDGIRHSVDGAPGGRWGCLSQAGVEVSGHHPPWSKRSTEREERVDINAFPVSRRVVTPDSGREREGTR